MFYKKIRSLTLECDCTSITPTRWDRLLKGAVRADKRKVNALVKKYLPELYESLVLQFPNHYKYFRTRNHIVLVHSGIEYFLRFK